MTTTAQVGLPAHAAAEVRAVGTGGAEQVFNQRPSPGARPAGTNGGEHALVTGDLMAWLALRRVSGGGVAFLVDGYYHQGRPVPHYLNAPLSVLVESGLLVLADADLDGVGMRQVDLTEGGRELYAALCGQRATSSVPRSNRTLTDSP